MRRALGWLTAAGVGAVILGGLIEACSQVAELDLTPILGSHAAAVVTAAGIVKIVLRLLLFVILGSGAKE